MSTSSVLDGHTVRAAELADAEDILKLVTAYNTTVVGFGDYTVDDVRNVLTEPGLDPAQDSWLVTDSSGLVAGFGWIAAEGDRHQVEIDLVAEDDAVGRWLLDRAMERASEMARDHGHGEVTVVHGVYRGDEALRERLRASGFRPATTFHRMRIDHRARVPLPEPPAGVRLRRGSDRGVRRAAHRVLMESFADHFGHVDIPYEEWHSRLESKVGFDWSQLWLAELEGEPAGLCVCNDQFVDENSGHIAQLGVVAAARGRGLAKYLLRNAFAVDAAAGRASTILHVDSNNSTPALQLYESVGMRPVLVVDAWQLVLRTDQRRQQPAPKLGRPRRG